MSRVQLALNVSDIDDAVEFYSRLFQTEPAKRRPGYANFAVAEPPLKLVLIENPSAAGTMNHLGIEVFSTDEVMAAQARLAGEGLATATEASVSCCFAVQDKVWVDDPDGAPWEVYTVLADADLAGGDLASVGRLRRRRLQHRSTGRRRWGQYRLRLLLNEVPHLPLWRRAFAELLGTLLLVATVVGSGIAGERLSDSTGLVLLINALATSGALAALILALGPLSGAHLNPLITVADAQFRGRSWRDVAPYASAQAIGAILGAVLANVMFDANTLGPSAQDRITGAHFVSEIVATFGLVLIVFTLTRAGWSAHAAAAVAGYIGAGYFFTSSTSFANPAVTIGRMFTDTFSGIAPASAPGFIAAQFLGAVLAVAAVRVLVPVPTTPDGAAIEEPTDV